MIVADIESTISLLLVVPMLFLALAGFGIAMVAKFVFRSVRDGYRKEGGAKGMRRKVVTKGAAALVRRLIFKKW